MQNVQFHLIDHCLPDYFKGHHLPVIQVPVFSNMTAGTVLKEILSELSLSFELFEEYTEEQIKEAADNWRQLYDLRKTFVYIDKEDRKALKDDMCDPAYLFFVCGVLHRPGSIFNEIKLPEPTI